MWYIYDVDPEELLGNCTGFDWDEGNLLKNWEKHAVSDAECEQVFFNRPLAAAQDSGHSAAEPRYYVLGQTNSGCRLFLVFTVRGDLIRVISAREISRTERRKYRRHG